MRLRHYTDCENLFREAYHSYVKQGKAVVIPGLGLRHEVILPTSSMKWVQTQPESVLSHIEAELELNQSEHSLGSGRYLKDDWGGMLIKKDLHMALEAICHGLNLELAAAFDTRFGTDTENWRDIDLFPTVRMLVAQAASSFTVGLPLCRNEEYLQTSMAISNDCVFVAGFGGVMPKIVQPVVGPIVGSYRVRRKLETLKKHVKPVYEERVQALLQKEMSGNDDQEPEPQDYIQMLLRHARTHRPDEYADLDIMTRRLALVNFASMHQTALQVMNMILNIVGSDGEYNTIAVLRDEVTRVIGPEPNKCLWTKALAAKLVRADSVARETLRLNSFGGRALFRTTMVDVETDAGVRIPKGNMVSFLGRPAQVDEAVYDEPLKYDPFRFSRVRESSKGKGEAAGVADDAATKCLGASFVTTSPEHLPFGHGKRACPGRFLIDFELKMIMAYLVTNYDIRFANGQQQRPQN